MQVKLFMLLLIMMMMIVSVIIAEVQYDPNDVIDDDDLDYECEDESYKPYRAGDEDENLDYNQRLSNSIFGKPPQQPEEKDKKS
ncbi:hypothetical protein LSTR_LSTR010471 [Laodelphax striatellus]|uniref:Uncharacterized protein n=1 Tax=Laodelphax striatellus TaxID=195883 RepID=A0A482X698_LAOST|nr:hypothetical protein LSTR_LSTR010471 [Laodelphax striatellus]